MENSTMFYTMSVEEAEASLKTNLAEGLSLQEAGKRLEKYGKNRIERKSKISPWEIFLRQFKNIIILLLIVASLVSFFVGDIVEAIAVIFVILLTTLFGFIMEYRAEKTIEALQKTITPTAKVIRAGTMSQIDAADLVPGDVIVLEEGDSISADGRLIEADNLAVDEAMLTGESKPVSKHIDAIKPGAKIAISDKKNLVFMGTAVTRGNGKALVTATGDTTQMGHISTLLQETEDKPTPLELHLKKTGVFLIVLTLIITAIIAVAGSLSGKPIIEMLKISVALAVAAVPEGLPAVATITLAIGMRRMARKNALVKTLPAVETLGSTTVICTDKTGTLTENQMTLQNIYLPDRNIIVSGTGYEPKGVFQEDNKEINVKQDEALLLFLTAGLLGSNAVLINEDKNDWQIIGDPTEGALITAAKKAGLDIKDLEERGYKRLDEIPFESDEMFMIVLSQMPDNDREIYLKGAPNVVLEMCKDIAINGSVSLLSEEKKEELKQENIRLAKKGLRVLAIAYKNNIHNDELNKEMIENDMIFLGFAGILDPPRPDVAEAIREATTAGIRTIMLTGDQPETATAIARSIGLQGAEEKVITGPEVDELPLDKLAERLRQSPVFARVSPKNKLDIIEALNKNNEITAMTGDGVNDAPALKKANIGISMGMRGTAVAKEASDMILLDDRFFTIVEAVRQGRVIFDNIQKFIHYLLSCNLSEILFIFITILLGVPTPLIALQILWLNLVTDIFPALAMAWEAPEAEIMTRQPRDPERPIISNKYKLRIGLQGLIITIGPVAVYLVSLSNHFTLDESRTIGFMALALVQLLHVFNVRRKNGLGFDKTVFQNTYLWGAIALTLLLQLFAVYTPIMQVVLHTTSLTATMWLYVLVGTLGPIALLQTVAAIRTLLNSSNQLNAL